MKHVRPGNGFEFKGELFDKVRLCCDDDNDDDDDNYDDNDDDYDYNEEKTMM